MHLRGKGLIPPPSVMTSSKSTPPRTSPFSSGSPSNTKPTPPIGTLRMGLSFSRTSMYSRWTANWYAPFTSSKEYQCLGFVVLAPCPVGWIGRLFHFVPVHDGYQSTQFGSFLSSGGIRSKIGFRNFGRIPFL